MINGVSLSSIEDINLTYASHYRQLEHIVRKDYSGFTQLERSLAHVVRKRKYNHERWKRFQLTKQSTEMQKDNASYRSKLDKIRMGRSTYNFTPSHSPQQTRAHNFYIRRRQDDIINTQNPEIARRIINVQGSFSHSKTDSDYSRTKEILQRLEKFPIIQRMTSFSHRKSIKTEGSQPSSPIGGGEDAALRRRSMERSQNFTRFRK